MKTDQQQVKHSKVSLIAKKIYFVDENINLKNACTVTFNGHKECRNCLHNLHIHVYLHSWLDKPHTICDKFRSTQDYWT